MTCIAALVTDKGFAYMAGDSAASDDRVNVRMADPKVQDFGNVLVGYSGSIMGGRKMFEAISRRVDQTNISTFIASQSEHKDFKATQFLVVEAGEIYEIEEGTLIHHFSKFAAIGSGAEVALGALFARHENLNDCLDAITAAATYTPNVRLPAIVVSCESI